MIISQLHIENVYANSIEEAYLASISYIAEYFGYSVHRVFDGILALDTNALELDLKSDFNYPLSAFAFDDNSDDFETDLYPELLDNSETESMLKTYINDGDISGYTDKDLEVMRLIEKYNKNVLALRATRKVEIENTINTSSDSSFAVDLTQTNQQLQRIANNLQDSKMVAGQEQITNVVQAIEQSSPIINLDNVTRGGF